MAKCRYSRSYDIVREPGNYLKRNGAKRYLMPKKPTNIVKSKTKICTRCKEELLRDNFYRNQSKCKPCVKECNKAYRQKREKLYNERFYGRKIDTNNEVK